MEIECHGKLVFLQDYLKKMVNHKEFRLCPFSPQPPYKMTIMKKNCYSYEGLYWTPNRDWGSSLDLHSFKAALWGHQN